MSYELQSCYYSLMIRCRGYTDIVFKIQPFYFTLIIMHHIFARKYYINFNAQLKFYIKKLTLF